MGTRLAGKIVSLVALLGTVFWFANDLDWESGVAVVGSLGPFVLLEIADQKQLRGLPERLAHDRDLFDRLEGLLPEQIVRNQLEGPIFNHETSRTFTRQMDLFVQLAGTEGGDFLDPKVQKAFEPYVRNVAELRGFIAHRFFMVRDDPDRLALHPEWRHQHGTEHAELYDRYVADLLRLNNETEDALRRYRAAVKQRLAR